MRAALIVLLLLAADTPKPDVAVLRSFVSGETLDFNLTWAGITGGSARMTIGPAPNDASRLRITSVAKSGRFFSRLYRIRDSIESLVTADNLSTLRYRKRLDERGKVKDELTLVDPERGLAMRKGKQIEVPSPVYDPLSMLYHLRRLELTPGASYRMDILADGKVHSIEIAVLHRETISTEAGKFATVVVEPKMRGAGIFRDEQDRLLIWISDDARHLPVRIRSDVKIGTITASLRAVRPGVVDAEPNTLRGQ